MNCSVGESLKINLLKREYGFYLWYMIHSRSMKKRAVCFLLLLAALASCTISRKSRQHLSSGQIAYTALNEDTLLSFQFIRAIDGRFFYTTSSIDSYGVVQQYHYGGQVRDTPDTLYLQYRKEQPHAGMPAYLVKEISGSFLIQTFTDGSPRVFMWVRYPILF